MTLTVLFDLDDTLLKTNIHVFFPEYFRGLVEALPGQLTVPELNQHLFASQRKMSNNPDPGKRLSIVFAEEFYPSIGSTEEACRDNLEKFYSEVHPTLQHLTNQMPGAHELVSWCQAQGIRMAIATNPLFPEVATHQRIQWAGFEPEDFSFFTNFDNSHFTKPSLTYYAEVLGRLGWPKAPVIMVGDDLDNDLVPTEIMGFSTFWVTSNGYHTHHPKGDLLDVKAFLKKQIGKKPFYISNQPDVLLAILRSTPAVIDTWLHLYPMDALTQQPTDDEANFVEVLGYMADFEEEINVPMWKRLLSNHEDPIFSTEPTDWLRERDNRDTNPSEIYESFLSSRRISLELVAELFEKLPLDTPLQHNLCGETTLHKLVEKIAKNDRQYLRHGAKVLGI